MLSSFDMQLLNELQTNLPLTERPYDTLAQKLGSDEYTVLQRVKALKSAGYIRRVGAFFDSESLGYHGTLVALKVRSDYLEQTANFINGWDGVTHNYERSGEYNLWFTLLTDSLAEQESILRRTAALPGVEKLLNLPAKKKYKINVRLDLKQV